MDLMAPLRAQRGLMSKTAKELGISRAAVSAWKKVPAELVVRVEEITGVPRQRLRPDLYRSDVLAVGQEAA